MLRFPPLVSPESFEIRFTSEIGGTSDGTGVDPFSLSNLVVLRDNFALTQDVDYTIDFDPTNNILRLIPNSATWPAGRTYVLRLDGVRDLAGNEALDNQIGGGVQFTIVTQFGTDFGDARQGYPSASHNIAEDFFLGQSVTPDAGDLFDAAASLDSGDDGVFLPDELLRNQNNTFTVQASGAGVLDAWFDFNANGAFEDSEYVLQGVDVVAGVNEVSVFLPQVAAAGEVFARFRLTSEGISSPAGLAPNGEVEDYVVAVEGGALWQNVINPVDVDRDGNVSPRDALMIIQEIDRGLASDPITRELDDPFIVPNTPSRIGFVDVSGDGFVSPRDLRLVLDAIQQLNVGNGEPSDAAMAGTTSLIVDPIGEILENPVVVLPAAPAAALDQVFVDDDEDLLSELDLFGE